MILVASAQLARTAIVDGFDFGIAAIRGSLLFQYRINSTWLIVSAAIARELLAWLGLPGIHGH